MKQDLKKLKKSIADLQELNRRNDLEAERLRKEFIVTHHPLKVGDILPADSEYLKGKSIVIDSCDFKINNYKFSWTAQGTVIRSNGKPGNLTVDWEKEVGNVTCKD